MIPSIWYFDGGGVGPYDTPLDEQEVIRDGDVKGKKRMNKAYKEIWNELWPKIGDALPGGDTGTVTIMNKLFYYDRKEKTLRGKDDNNITNSTAILLSLKYIVQLTRQKQKKTMTELVTIIIGIEGNAQSTTLTVSSNTYFINKDDLRLATKNNPISMNMLRYLCRQNGVSCRKEIPDTYKVEDKPNTTDD